jgi:hypothetical protein
MREKEGEIADREKIMTERKRNNEQSAKCYNKTIVTT